MERTASTSIVSAALAAALAVSAPGAAGATDFIRGDVNQDGVVSIADAHFLSMWLFAYGEWPECWNAADANDSAATGGSGMAIDISDIAAILTAWTGSSMLPAPFPELGADPTPNAPDAFFYLDPDGFAHPGAPDCASYGGGAPLEDPAAELAILDAVAPGGADGWAVLSVAISSSAPLAGLGAWLGIGGEAVGAVGRPTSRLPDGSGSYVGATPTDAGLRFFQMVAPWDLDEGEALPAGSGVHVLDVPICLRPGLPAGEYAISVDGAELVDFSSARRIDPRTAEATLTVLQDVDPGWSCEGGVDPPPPALNAEYRLGSARAAPGTVASIPFSIRADAPVQGYGVSIDFDEEALSAESVEEVWRRPDGKDLSFAVYEFDNENATPGNAGVDEGFVVGAVVLDFLDAVSLPGGVETEVLRLRMRVRPEAPVAVTQLSFLAGGQGSGAPVPNRVAAHGFAYTPDLAESFVFIAGGIDIVPDIVVFIRGDSNGDLAVDLSDPIATLAWLFTGGEAPYCLDAADANDDGTLEITDPIYLLQHLFLGGPAPAPPYPDEGEDPTEDGMGCL